MVLWAKMVSLEEVRPFLPGHRHLLVRPREERCRTSLHSHVCLFDTIRDKGRKEPVREGQDVVRQAQWRNALTPRIDPGWWQLKKSQVMSSDRKHAVRYQGLQRLEL